MERAGSSAGFGRRAVIAGAPAALLTAACARRRDPDALSFWGMSYEGDYAPHLTADFTARTGVPVEVQSLPWTAAHEKLLTAHSGRSLPDVMMMPARWVGEFAMVGALAPVPSPALVADTFPGSREPTRFGGRDMAVPWSLAPEVQFFRRDILADAGYAAPPEDWDGWRAMARAIKRRRPGEYVFLMLLNWQGALMNMLAQTGAVLLRDRNTRGNFRTAEAREALGYYVSLYAEGLAPKMLSTEVQDQFAAFAQGFFAVWPAGPTLLLDLSRRSAELPPDKWGTARVSGPKGPGPVSNINSVLCVSAATRRPALAWALVAHLTSTANELRFQRLIGNLPARRSAWASPQLAGPVIAPFAEQIRQPFFTPQVVEWEQIELDIQLVAERVVRGLMTVEEGLADMDRRADAILARRRALVEAGRIA